VKYIDSWALEYHEWREQERTRIEEEDQRFRAEYEASRIVPLVVMMLMMFLHFVHFNHFLLE